MQQHPLTALRRLIAGFPEDPKAGMHLDTMTVLERTGLPTLRKMRPWLRGCDAALAPERRSVHDATHNGFSRTDGRLPGTATSRSPSRPWRGTTSTRSAMPKWR